MEPSYLRIRKFRLRQKAPVAGGFGQFRQRAAGEHVLIVAADVGDGIVTTIVTADHISGLGHILGTVRGNIDRPIRILADGTRVCSLRFLGVGIFRNINVIAHLCHRAVD